MWFDAETKARWLRTGHPDFASFNHDLYRGMSAQPFWVMEQQPGPVNWAHWNRPRCPAWCACGAGKPSRTVPVASPTSAGANARSRKNSCTRA
jgi:hypothetical protein